MSQETSLPQKAREAYFQGLRVVGSDEAAADLGLDIDPEQAMASFDRGQEVAKLLRRSEALYYQVQLQTSKGYQAGQEQLSIIQEKSAAREAGSNDSLKQAIERSKAEKRAAARAEVARQKGL